jgi:hypothetical protein
MEKLALDLDAIVNQITDGKLDVSTPMRYRLEGASIALDVVLCRLSTSEFLTRVRAGVPLNSTDETLNGE